MSKSTEEEMISIHAELMELLNLKRQLGNYEEKKRELEERYDQLQNKQR
ncbi:hypothetical protein ABKP09_13535 [Peribacillus frigoritolerans]